MGTATTSFTFIDLPYAAGVTHRTCVESRLWVQLRTFPFKKDALAFCEANGLPKAMVQKRFGRFEFGWVLMSGSQAMAR